MLLRAYCIYDVKSQVYHPPYFGVTDGAAVRNLQDLVSDLNTTIGRHPGDYTLYCVGVFDDQTGQIEGFVPRLHVADAASLVPVQGALPLGNGLLKETA